jgi:AcrR family transcriptional regulator
MDRPPRRDLREACIAEAFAIVGEAGVSGLSIREVARRLGVSHQAPYKHFPSSEHLLAEILKRTYEQFACHLRSRPVTGEPAADMRSLGEAYLDFAQRHPMLYQLMFSTTLPKPEAHPETMQAARDAFGILIGAIQKMRGLGKGGAARREASMDALFVWSAVHGLATILDTTVLHQLGFSAAMHKAALPELLLRIGKAMGDGPTSS